jgi:hypothetical protein
MGVAILTYDLEVYEKGGGSGPFTRIDGYTLPSLLTQYTIPGLTAVMTYYFKYRAQNMHE